MGTIRFAAALVEAAYRYDADLAEEVSVGSIARFLSQHDAYVDANTMELARLIEPAQRLQDIHLQTGDRLALVMQPPHDAELPAALHPGDRLLKFSLGEYVVSSRGRKLLLVGRPDESRQLHPDIDLRHFIPSHALGYISRQCLRLYFDDATKQWYALKTGQTRLMIDEFELGDEEVAIDGEMWLRFYRASDDPKAPSSRPVGALRLQVEEVQTQTDAASLRAGLTPVSLCIGSERESQTLNASGNLVLEQLVTGLARYHHRLPTPDARIYLMRLLSPEVKIGALGVGADEFLYVPRSVRYTENVLLLRDVHDRERVYTLRGGLEDSDLLIGRRPSPEVSDPALAVDLYLPFEGRDDGSILRSLSRYQAWVMYRAWETAWWVKADERALMPIYVNHLRVDSATPAQLTSGDVLTIGPTLDEYFVRLEVEITMKSG